MPADEHSTERGSGAPNAVVVWIVTAFVFAGAWVWISATIPARPAELVLDEVPWTRHGHVLLRHYLRLEWGDPIWAEALDAFGYRHPRLGLYVVAAADSLAARLTGDRVRNLRRLMSLITAAAVAALFFAAARRWSWAPAAAAATLLLLHPAFSAVSTSALPEAPLLLFAALAMGPAARIRRWFNEPLQPALFGVWAGLATSCRLHGASLAIAGVLLALFRPRTPLRNRLRAAAIVSAAAAAMFWLTNPTMFRYPVMAVRGMTTEHLRAVGTSPSNFNPVEAADLGYAMLTAFDPGIASFYGYVPDYRRRRSPYALIGAAMLIIGLWRCARARDATPPVFAAASVLLCLYVGSVMLPVIKNALPAVVCLAWLEAQTFRMRAP